MLAPIGPMAWTALRVGAVAALALYAARGRSRPKHAEHERVLDELPEGVGTHPHRAEAETALHGQGRFRRVFRLHPTGPGIEIDAAGLGRVRLRRL